MGLSVHYRSTRPVLPDQAAEVERAAGVLSHGRSWLSCEPILFFSNEDDGHLSGSSKPCFMPHPDDADDALRSGLPDGTVRDLLEILSQLSHDHQIDWEISHDESDGPVGYIRRGRCDRGGMVLMEGYPSVGELFGNQDVGNESRTARYQSPTPPDRKYDGDEDDEPPILPFKPRVS